MYYRLTEEKLIKRLHLLKNKYSQYIPADVQDQFEQDIYATWKTVVTGLYIIQYYQKDDKAA